MAPLRFSKVQCLADPAHLEALFGPIEAVERSALPTVGFSGSSHERLRVRVRGGGASHDLVLKSTPLHGDWTLALSGDVVGREARLIDEPSLAAVWEIFRCPYLAFAREPDRIGMLMPDFTARLFPDAREPLRADQEEALLSVLASLHARFWESPALDLPWLSRPEGNCGMLAPGRRHEERTVAGFPAPLQLGMRRGWPAALAALPARAARRLEQPVEEIVAGWRDLPRTLVHGDVKVANFALLDDGAVSAFDWAIAAAAPISVEVGWYLAVNASRLARSKEDLLARYRQLLETRLEAPLTDATWERLSEASVVSGALMLLWSKGLALEAGRPGAREEMNWWAQRLEAWAGRPA